MTPEQADILIMAIQNLTRTLCMVGIATIIAVIAARFIKL